MAAECSSLRREDVISFLLGFVGFHVDRALLLMNACTARLNPFPATCSLHVRIPSPGDFNHGILRVSCATNLSEKPIPANIICCNDPISEGRRLRMLCILRFLGQWERIGDSIAAF